MLRKPVPSVIFAKKDLLPGKKILLQNLNYWNVDLQEPYYSYIEANSKRDQKK